MFKYAQTDLEEIHANLSGTLDSYLNGRIMISGATGFIGSWILDSFLFLKNNYAPNLLIAIVVRDESKVSVQHCIQVIKVSELTSLGPIFKPTHIFHAATIKRQSRNSWQTEEAKIMDLTSTLIKIAKSSKATIVNLSSGAVYGQEIRKQDLIINSNNTTADYSDLDQYGIMKVKTEQLIDTASASENVLGVNTRLFSFYGPGLNLDEQFAISEFVNAASKGNEIIINGNPATVRSLMYPTDLVTNILQSGNSLSSKIELIGSNIGLTMLEIAEEVGRVWNVGVSVNNNNNLKPNYYYPRNPSLTENISLHEGLKRWKKWLMDF
jgi:dTDP-glucose 4,6-dehydratase